MSASFATTNQSDSSKKLLTIQDALSGAKWKATGPALPVAPTERLQELLILEMTKDGGHKYINLTVRGLYRYVLDAITSTVRPTRASSANGNESLEEDRATLPAVTVEDPAAEDVMSTAKHSTTASSGPPQPPPSTTATTTTATTSTATPSKQFLHGGSTRRSTMASARNVVTGDVPLTPSSTATTTTRQQAPATVAMTTYRERLGGYLHPRDMRRLVTSFSTSNEPELIVRRHVILLNFDPLRTILVRDRLLVIVPNGADTVLTMLEKRVRGGAQEVENSIFGQAATNPALDYMKPTTTSSSSSFGGGVGTKVTKKILKTIKRGAEGAVSSLTGSYSGNTAKPTSKNSSSESSSLTKTATTTLGSNAPKTKPAAVPLDHQRPSASSEWNGGLLDDAPTEPESDDCDDCNQEEWRELKESSLWAHHEFELQCVDAVLHVVGSILTQDTCELHTTAKTYIDRLLGSGQHHHYASLLSGNGSSGLGDDPLTVVRVITDAVQLMTNRVRSFAQSLNRLLDDDESMALMNLSRLITHPEKFIQPVPQHVLDEESDEPELLLEANLQHVHTLLNNLDLVKGQINSAKEFLDQKQDATRNRLLLANMVISVFSLCATLASLVGSFMGMNLTNGLETNNNAFRQITFGTVASGLAMCVFIMAILWFSGTIPRTSRGTLGST